VELENRNVLNVGEKVHILMILVVLVEEMDISLAQDVMDAVNLF
jgi:hypothetical protein